MSTDPILDAIVERHLLAANGDPDIAGITATEEIMARAAWDPRIRDARDRDLAAHFQAAIEDWIKHHPGLRSASADVVACAYVAELQARQPAVPPA